MRQLGDLEAAVMRRLWSADEPLSVRDVLADLNADPGRGRRLAYTTVRTVMDNLHRKGVVSRELAGRAHLYSAARTREEYAADLIATFLDDADDRTAPLLRFVDRLTPAEVRRLRAALDRPGVDGTPQGGTPQGGAPGETRRRRGGRQP